MSQADTNGNNIGFNFTGTGAIPQTVNIITDGSPPDVNLKNAAGTAVTLDANNVLNVSTKYIGGTLQTARDLGASVLLAADQAVNTTKFGGTTVTGRDLGASVLVSPGTGTGQIDVTSGVVKANLAQILGTALTETAGQIAAAFKKFFDKSSPTGTVNSLPDAVPGAANGLLVDDVWTDARAAKLDNLDVAVSTRNSVTPLDAAGVRSAVGLASANLDTQLSGIAAAVWDRLTSALTTVGSIGKLLVDRIDATISSRSTYAGTDTSGTTTLLSRLTSTRAGNLDNLDAAISSRSTYAGTDTSGTTTLLSRLTVTRAGNLDNLDAQVSLIKSKTDNLPASPAAIGDIPTTTQIVNGVLNENLTGHQTSGTTGEALVNGPYVKGFRQGGTGNVVRFSGGEISPSYQGQQVIVMSGGFTVAYDNQFQGMLFVVSDTANSGIEFVAGILSSDASDNSLTLSQTVPSVGTVDPIPFLILPAGMGDASRVASDVWDEDIATEHDTDGSAGKRLKSATDLIPFP